MRFEAFSESYAYGGGFIRRMDARAKLIFAGACLALSVTHSNPAAPAAVGTVCLVLLLASGVPVRAVLIRLAEPLVFALILSAMQALITQGAPILSLHLLGMTISASAEGLHRGLVIMARVFGASGAVLFLTMTTPAHRLLSAAARLKAPRALVELSLLTYRYVFVLMEDAITVYQAQKGRLGYSGLVRGIRSLATLAGSVFLRAYGQAEATGEAMSMRGYTGEYVPECRDGLRATDAVFLSVFFIPCLAVYLWTS